MHTQTLVDIDIDIEALLENTGAHFRSVHWDCLHLATPGQIIESNCGVLYRAKGRRVPLQADRCKNCVRRTWDRPCPFCGRLS